MKEGFDSDLDKLVYEGSIKSYVIDDLYDIVTIHLNSGDVIEITAQWDSPLIVNVRWLNKLTTQFWVVSAL